MKIQNSNYEVEFVERGGEILAFTNKTTKMQYMYQGDTEYWEEKIQLYFQL